MVKVALSKIKKSLLPGIIQAIKFLFQSLESEIYESIAAISDHIGIKQFQQRPAGQGVSRY